MIVLHILYQDKYLIAINKPPGLLSVPGLGDDKQDCVATRIQQLIPDAKIVHRLDCHTSGVMLMAIGLQSQRALNRQFHDRQVNKEYVAIVSGHVNEKHGEIDVPMRGDPDQRPVQIIDHESGKQAITKWKNINFEENNTRLLLIPVTGRTHQLRVHCKYIGHPVVGDRLYGTAQSDQQERMLLHAALIEFIHPRSGRLIKLESPSEF